MHSCSGGRCTHGWTPVCCPFWVTSCVPVHQVPGMRWHTILCNWQALSAHVRRLQPMTVAGCRGCQRLAAAGGRRHTHAPMTRRRWLRAVWVTAADGRGCEACPSAPDCERAHRNLHTLRTPRTPPRHSWPEHNTYRRHVPLTVLQKATGFAIVLLQGQIVPRASQSAVTFRQHLRKLRSSCVTLQNHPLSHTLLL
jgi:hypothetical protein